MTSDDKILDLSLIYILQFDFYIVMMVLGNEYIREMMEFDNIPSE